MFAQTNANENEGWEKLQAGQYINFHLLDIYSA